MRQPNRRRAVRQIILVQCSPRLHISLQRLHQVFWHRHHSTLVALGLFTFIRFQAGIPASRLDLRRAIRSAAVNFQSAHPSNPWKFASCRNQIFAHLISCSVVPGLIKSSEGIVRDLPCSNRCAGGLGRGLLAQQVRRQARSPHKLEKRSIAAVRPAIDLQGYTTCQAFSQKGTFHPLPNLSAHCPPA